MLLKNLMLQNSVLMLELQHKLLIIREVVKLPNLYLLMLQNQIHTLTEILEYISGTSGIGTNLKLDFRVNVDGNISEFSVLEEGTAYKVGDRLTVSGIATDPRVGVNTEFQLIVEELENDTFSGFYPGSLYYLMIYLHSLMDNVRSLLYL